MMIAPGQSAINRAVSVAPMMDWTDRHCRYFLRQFSPDVLLYTEMITAAALLHGDAKRLLAYDLREHPLALQLGGSEPKALAQAAKMGADAGYLEINLNCGCPSDRVSAGAFGACLMLDAARVAECVEAMAAAVSVPVTVKLRIGVVSDTRAQDRPRREAMLRFDEADFDSLAAFCRQQVAAGASALIVHARKAVLGGLTPHENRTVPPLRYDVVQILKRALPKVPVILNGGLRTAESIIAALTQFDGVMVGREAYHRPWLLTQLQSSALTTIRAEEVLSVMEEYAARELALGTRLQAITRHMLGLLGGRPGARQFRNLMTEPMRGTYDLAELFAEAREIARGNFTNFVT
jgi:tRNA-dihydrouridine synthase A